jgi:hypothetical protein
MRAIVVEKRREPRVEVNWPISVFMDNNTIEGTTKDISLNGICIQCKSPFPLEENIPISMFPPRCKPIKLVGKAVWSDSYALNMDNNNAPVCIGLSFVELPARDRYILKEVIDTPLE